MQVFRIDFENLIKTRFPNKRIPGFVIAFLSRLFHVKEFNQFFEYGYQGREFCDKVVETLDLKLSFEGEENLASLAPGQKCVFAANHPLGGIDGVVLLSYLCAKYDSKIKFLANDFVMELKPLESFGIPVNKIGAQSRNLPGLVREMYESDNQILIFPAGICSRKIDGVIQDYEWTKSFVAESRRSGRTIVPVHIYARNSWLFYFVDGIGRLFRMKFKLAMLLLPREVFKGKGKRVRVVFGKPVSASCFDDSRTNMEWAQEVRKQVYEI